MAGAPHFRFRTTTNGRLLGFTIESKSRLSNLLDVKKSVAALHALCNATLCFSYHLQVFQNLYGKKWLCFLVFEVGRKNAETLINKRLVGDTSVVFTFSHCLINKQC